MTFTEELVGSTSERVERSWTAQDAMLYAVAVGAGHADPRAELAFTTDNTDGVRHQVLPTFACVALNGRSVPLPEAADLSRMLHAEQGFEIFQPLPVEGNAVAQTSITGVYDKGSGALVTTRTMARDATGQPLAALTSGLFFRGYGGWGGSRGTSEEGLVPSGRPDHEISYVVPEHQALLYRLTGDRNPLHSDPAFAARAGFPGPILHGMCTYGYTGRALLHAAGSGDPERFRSMRARFTRTVLPGTTLTVRIWADGDDVRFQTLDAQGAVVLDRGYAVIG